MTELNTIKCNKCNCLLKISEAYKIEDKWLCEDCNCLDRNKKNWTVQNPLNMSKIIENPLEDTWQYLECEGKKFSRYDQNFRYKIEDGSVTVTIETTIFIPDTDAQHELKQLMNKWRSENKGYLSDAIGEAISKNCRCTPKHKGEDLIEYLGEDRLLEPEIYVFNLKDCVFYRYNY